MIKKLVINFLVVIIVVIPVIIWVQSGKVNVAYVELNEVYNEFEMKKELEKKFESVTQKRTFILDSLELQLKILENKINASLDKNEAKQGIIVFEGRKEEYLMLKQNFEEDNERTSGEYDNQIWKQISQYMKDYGKENNYTYILGAEGSGHLMYAEKENDVTKDVVDFINKKYKGITK